jgi:glycosyltransferase involved in cell wall biosynthesis
MIIEAEEASCKEDASYEALRPPSQGSARLIGSPPVIEPSQRQRIFILSTSTFSQEGGIQCVTRMVLRLLRETWPGTALDLFSLHDLPSEKPNGSLTEALETGYLAYQPCASSRVRFSRAVLRAMLARKPALVVSDHAHLSLVPWLGRRLATSRSVALVHYAELNTLGWLRRHALRQADLIVAVSKFTAQTTQQVLGQCPVRVCHLGLHPEYAQWAERHLPAAKALGGRRPILIVGRMADPSRDKGHEALIRAMPALAKRVPNSLLVIVGRGNDEPRLRLLSAELGLDAQVHFAGLVRDEELPSYYEAAEVFAMPSSAEGFGLVYLEAMYHGKPCIAGNRDGAQEVVSDGETGLLVEPGNVGQIQETLLRLLLDREMARKLGTAGREKLQRCFTYEHFAARFRDLVAPFLPASATNLCVPQ